MWRERSFSYVKIIKTSLVIISFFELGAQAAQQCYKCTGFDADEKNLFYKDIVKELRKHPNLPRPVEDRCINDPSTFVTCDSYCVAAVATINLKNLGGIELGMSYDELVLDQIRSIGTARMVVRGCFDTLGNGTDTEELKALSKIYNIEKEEVCIDGKFKISGINVEGDICFCQKDACNKKQPKQIIAAGDVPPPIDDTSYTATCPTPQLNYTSLNPNKCTKKCQNDSDCSQPVQLCCNVGGCDYLCSSPIYEKPFIGGSCSQMVYTQDTLHALFDKFMKVFLNEFQPYSPSDIPPPSKECFKQPPKKSCQTLAYAFSLRADFTNIEELSEEKTDLLKKALEEYPSSMGDLSDEDLSGKISAVMRGCAEDILPMAFSSGFPRLGPVSGTLRMNETLMGAGIEFHLLICNTDECNLLPVSSAGDPANAAYSSVTLILLMLISFLLCI